MDTLYNLILGGCRFLYSSYQTFFYCSYPERVVPRKQIYIKMKRKNSDYDNGYEDEYKKESIPLEQKPVLIHNHGKDENQVKKLKRTISQEKDLHLFLQNVEVRNRRNSDSNLYYGYFVYIGKNHIKKGDDYEFL